MWNVKNSKLLPKASSSHHHPVLYQNLQGTSAQWLVERPHFKWRLFGFVGLVWLHMHTRNQIKVSGLLREIGQCVYRRRNKLITQNPVYLHTPSNLVFPRSPTLLLLTGGAAVCSQPVESSCQQASCGNFPDLPPPLLCSNYVLREQVKYMTYGKKNTSLMCLSWLQSLNFFLHYVFSKSSWSSSVYSPNTAGCRMCLSQR